MLNRKMYMVWDTSLIQSVFRNKDLSMLPFAREFVTVELGLKGKVRQLVEETNMVSEFFPRIHGALAAQHVKKMNRVALDQISDQLNDAFDGVRGDWLEVPNLYLWVRQHLFVATTEALYGRGNIFRDNAALEDDFWCVCVHELMPRVSRLTSRQDL